MMNVVLLIPAIFSGSSFSLLAAADAEADEEAVTRTTVELREAVTTLVWVMDDRVDVSDVLGISEEDSTAEDDGVTAAIGAGSVDDAGASSEVTVSTTLAWAVDEGSDSCSCRNQLRINRIQVNK